MILRARPSPRVWYGFWMIPSRATLRRLDRAREAKGVPFVRESKEMPYGIEP